MQPNVPVQNTNFSTCGRREHSERTSANEEHFSGRQHLHVELWQDSPSHQIDVQIHSILCNRAWIHDCPGTIISEERWGQRRQQRVSEAHRSEAMSGPGFPFELRDQPVAVKVVPMLIPSTLAMDANTSEKSMSNTREGTSLRIASTDSARSATTRARGVRTSSARYASRFLCGRAR